MSPFATPAATSENFAKPIVDVKMMKMKVVKMRSSSSDSEKGSANGDAGATQDMLMDAMPMDDDP